MPKCAYRVMVPYWFSGQRVQRKWEMRIFSWFITSSFYGNLRYIGGPLRVDDLNWFSRPLVKVIGQTAVPHSKGNLFNILWYILLILIMAQWSYWSILNSFVCSSLTSHTRIFHSYGNAAFSGEGLQILIYLIYARHTWPMSSEGFFSVPNLLWHGASAVYNGHLLGPVSLTHRYMAEKLPIRRKTLSTQLINQSINRFFRVFTMFLVYHDLKQKIK